MYDYHTHGHFSFDCVVDLEDMVQAGIQAGLVQLALTDHYEPFYPNPAKLCSFDFAAYDQTIRALQRKYEGQISLRKGLELGLQSNTVLPMTEAISGETFDFLIGSFHYVDSYELCDPHFYASRSPAEAYRRFFTICLETLQQFQNYDVMGHVNIIGVIMPAK